MPIADWLPYPPTLYINIGFGPIKLKLLIIRVSYDTHHNDMINDILSIFKIEKRQISTQEEQSKMLKHHKQSDYNNL